MEEQEERWQGGRVEEQEERWQGGRVEEQEVTGVGKVETGGLEKKSSDENHNYISDSIPAGLPASGSTGEPSAASLPAGPLVGATGGPQEACEQCLEGRMEEAVRRMKKVAIL